MNGEGRMSGTPVVDYLVRVVCSERVVAVPTAVCWIDGRMDEGGRSVNHV